MGINWPDLYSGRVARLYGSMTRKLMHVMSDPDIISFGGGLPAWDLFPVDQVRQVTDELLRHDGPAILQYSTSEGYGPLRRQIAERYAARGFRVVADDVLIDTGSMQGLDLLAKLLLDPGDTVVVADPTFLTALQAFSFYGARYLTVPVDAHGMQVERLPELLAGRRVKFIYVMPTFQNPTGRTLALDRRRQLIEIAARHGVLIVEDDSYGELRYEGQALPPLKALDRHDGVVYLGSFSKVLGPGLRVGFVMAPAALMENLVLVKQTADLHTSVLPQRIVQEFLRQGLLDPHIDRLIDQYRRRRDLMLAAVREYLPAGVRWTRPQGGLFLWLTLPPALDADSLFDDALAAGVAYVPGSHYFAYGGGADCLRLNFVTFGDDRVAEGIRRLALALERQRRQPA